MQDSSRTSDLPTVQFVSTDCGCLVSIVRGVVHLKPINAVGLLDGCPTICIGDSIFGLSVGLDGQDTFWEMNNETLTAHPTPPIPTTGGTFLAYDRRLLLVGSKTKPNEAGETGPGPFIVFNTKKKRWTIMIKTTDFESSPGSGVHPMSLIGAGVSLLRGVDEAPDMLVFVGGEYLHKGKMKANRLVMWLVMSSLEYGAYSLTMPVTLSSPHVACTGPNELIVAGGLNLKTDMKSKRVMTVNISANTVSDLPALPNILAACRIGPGVIAEYVAFFSWPRVTYYNRTTKTYVNKSIRKSKAFKSERFIYKRRDSMDSDVSSAYQMDSKESNETEGFIVKRRVSKTTKEVTAPKVETNLHKAATMEEEAKRAKDSSSSDEGAKTVHNVGRVIRKQPTEDPQPKVRTSFRTKAGFHVKIKEDMSDSEASAFGGQPPSSKTLPPHSSSGTTKLDKQPKPKSYSSSSSESQDEGKATVRPSYIKPRGKAIQE
jgi:hypothetical protein